MAKKATEKLMEIKRLKNYINDTWSNKELAKYLWLSVHAINSWKKIPTWHRKRVVERLENNQVDAEKIKDMLLK